MRQVILKLFLSESDCNVPMELCLTCTKGTSGGGGDSGSPLTVEGTDGSHTLVGVLGGGATNMCILAPEVSSKSQSRVRNLKD